MECLICGNKDKFVDYFSSSRLKRCQKCGFVFDISFNKGKKENYEYKENYSCRLTLTKQESRLRNCQSRLRTLKKIIRPDTSVLDIGCNEGLFLKLVKDFGCRVHGLEPNYEMIKYAKKMGLAVEQGTIEEFKTDKKFDFIALFHVLEHLAKPKEALKKIAIWLKSNGFLVLELPNIESYLAKKERENWEMINSEHLFYFSPKTIKLFLEDNGFRMQEIHFRQFDEWNLSIKESLNRLGFNLSKRKNKAKVISLNSEEKKGLNLGKILLKPFRFFLTILIKIMKRGDYILVIAKKANNNHVEC